MNVLNLDLKCFQPFQIIPANEGKRAGSIFYLADRSAMHGAETNNIPHADNSRQANKAYQSTILCQ